MSDSHFLIHFPEVYLNPCDSQSKIYTGHNSGISQIFKTNNKIPLEACSSSVNYLRTSSLTVYVVNGAIPHETVTQIKPKNFTGNY